MEDFFSHSSSLTGMSSNYKGNRQVAQRNLSIAKFHSLQSKVTQIVVSLFSTDKASTLVNVVRVH